MGAAEVGTDSTHTLGVFRLYVLIFLKNLSVFVSACINFLLIEKVTIPGKNYISRCVAVAPITSVFPGQILEGVVHRGPPEALCPFTLICIFTHSLL